MASLWWLSDGDILIWVGTHLVRETLRCRIVSKPLTYWLHHMEWIWQFVCLKVLWKSIWHHVIFVRVEHNVRYVQFAIHISLQKQNGDVIMGTITSQITSLTVVYSTVYSDIDQRKHQNSASLAFVQGIHRGPVNSPYKWPVTRKMFPFDDVIMLQVCLTGVGQSGANEAIQKYI